MKLRTMITLSTAMAGLAFASSAGAAEYRIGITQNNVGVDSYQTTYDKAFKEAVEANDNVEAVVLDAGGDVARQIAQIEDLIQQEVQAIIIWPTNGEAVIPAVRKAKNAGIPVIVTNSNIAEAGFDFVKSFSGPDNITQGSRSAEIMCDKFKEMGIETTAQVVQISGQPGYTTAIERQKGFDDRLPEVCPDVTVLETQPGDWNREKSQKVMEAFLVKYDKIDGVYAGDDNMGVGALNAAKAAGREGIIFVGATNFAVGYEAMEKGEYWGSIYQSPVDDAKAALKTAIDVLMERKCRSSTTSTRRRSPRTTCPISPSRFSEPRGISSPDAASAASGSILLSLPCDRGGEHGPVVWTLLHCHRSRARNWQSHWRGAPVRGSRCLFCRYRW
jgi:ribose transport system substrate-binding protein